MRRIFRAPRLKLRGATLRVTESRIGFISSNLICWQALRNLLEFDVIVSNPPYVAERDAKSLPRDVREHEPHIALFAGDAGLDVYAPLIVQAESRLRRGGILVLELGFGTFEAVSDMLDSARGWTRVSATMDLAGIPRVLSATKS